MSKKKIRVTENKAGAYNDWQPELLTLIDGDESVVITRLGDMQDLLQSRENKCNTHI